MIEAYRLVEVKNNEYYTLFHGINRCRKLPINKWFQSERKMVKDGSGSTEYLSGFNILADFKYALKYLNNFNRGNSRRDIRIIKCYIAGELREKPTNHRVLLAEKMIIPEKHPAHLSIHGVYWKIAPVVKEKGYLVDCSVEYAREKLYEKLVNLDLTIITTRRDNCVTALPRF